MEKRETKGRRVRNGKYQVYIGIEEEGKSIWFGAVLCFPIGIRVPFIKNKNKNRNRINYEFILYTMLLSIYYVFFSFFFTFIGFIIFFSWSVL